MPSLSVMLYYSMFSLCLDFRLYAFLLGEITFSGGRGFCFRLTLRMTLALSFLVSLIAHLSAFDGMLLRSQGHHAQGCGRAL